MCQQQLFGGCSGCWEVTLWTRPERNVIDQSARGGNSQRCYAGMCQHVTRLACVNVLKSDLHTLGFLPWGQLFPKMGVGEQTLIPWPLLPVHTLPWACPLGLLTSATLVEFLRYDWLSLYSQLPSAQASRSPLPGEQALVLFRQGQLLVLA